MSITKEESQRLIKFWGDHLKQWSRSRTSQNEYCRKNNLKPNRFTYWKTKLKKQNLPAEFVQVPDVQVSQIFNSPAPKGLKLNIDTGFQIEIPDGFCQTTLNKVLQVLEKV